MADRDIRTHEITFCSRVSKWADSFFEKNPALAFKRTEIEESKGIKRKRSDLRVYGAHNKLILAGEVKLPGTAEGRNAYNSALVDDSYFKASNAGAEFFFTWNVNKFVLFDSKKWHLPIMEQRVKDYDLELDLDNPDDVSRAEVENRIQKFLADFFADLQAIMDGKQPDWGTYKYENRRTHQTNIPKHSIFPRRTPTAVACRTRIRHLACGAYRGVTNGGGQTTRSALGFSIRPKIAIHSGAFPAKR
jgi:hypothetical protein